MAKNTKSTAKKAGEAKAKATAPKLPAKPKETIHPPASSEEIPGNQDTGSITNLENPEGLPEATPPQHKIAEKGTPALMPTPEQIATMSNTETSPVAPEDYTLISRQIVDSKEGSYLEVVRGKKGEEKTEQHKLTPAQVEAYHRHKNIKWANEGEKDAAEAITLYAFGIGDRAKFEKKVKSLTGEDRERFFGVAEKVGYGDVVNNKVFPLK